MLVHLYGQCAEIEPILAACQAYGVHLIEDAAEALGASYKGRSSRTLGKAGIFSFNGNKNHHPIKMSRQAAPVPVVGGGMRRADDGDFIAHRAQSWRPRPAILRPTTSTRR